MFRMMVYNGGEGISGWNLSFKHHIACCIMLHLHVVEFICISLSHLGVHGSCLKPVVLLLGLRLLLICI